jgi:hypothetical protein
MTTVKSLAIIALLVGGTSLAIAQNGPPTGGQTPPPAAAPPGPGIIPHDATAGSNLQSAAPTTRTRTRLAHQQPTKNHQKMYMSAKGPHHKTLKDNSRLQTMPKQ